MSNQKVNYCAKYRHHKKRAREDLANLASYSFSDFADTDHTDHSEILIQEFDSIYHDIQCHDFESITDNNHEFMDEYQNEYEYYHEYECDTKDSDVEIEEAIEETVNSKTISNNSAINPSERFLSFLKQHANRFRVPHVQINSLLKGLNEHFNLNLPVDARTLLDTARHTDIKLMTGIAGKEGEFVYLGIVSGILPFLSSDVITSKIEDNTLKLIFNIDGVPVCRSSNKQFWPILGKIYIPYFNIHPFTIAIYCGDSKPNLNSFLDKFINELQLVNQEGLSFNGILYKIELFCITCDAPARAYIKAIIGHNGTHGCERCIQKGINIQRRMVYSSKTSQLRTNQNFRNQQQALHHNGVSPLTKINDLNMVHAFSLDYMHLCCIGVMKKMLRFWFKDTGKYKLPIRIKHKVSEYLLYIRDFIPSEFSRRPRSLNELEHWKATELRTFLIYVGPMVLKNILEPKLYNHFLLYHCALRILLSKDVSSYDVDCARQLLTDFVKDFGLIYGKLTTSYNVHSLLHIPDDIDYFQASLDEVSCFAFENYLGKMIKMIRTPNRPLAQVVRRLSENKTLYYEKVKVTAETEMHISNFYISSINSKDGFVLIQDGSIMKITLIAGNKILGYKCEHTDNFFSSPFNSSAVGVYTFKNIGPTHLQITANDIVTKMFVIQEISKHFYVAFAMLHTDNN